MNIPLSVMPAGTLAQTFSSAMLQQIQLSKISFEVIPLLDLLYTGKPFIWPENNNTMYSFHQDIHVFKINDTVIIYEKFQTHDVFMIILKLAYWFYHKVEYS